MIKNSLIFFTFLFLSLIGEYLLLTTLHQRLYSDAKYQQMITGVSSLRDVTDNPCQYSVLGEPPLPPNQYLKVHFYCASGQKSLSTLDPRALTDLSYRGILESVSRLNGFTLVFTNNQPVSFTCTTNSSPITDYQKKSPLPTTIECHYAKK